MTIVDIQKVLDQTLMPRIGVYISFFGDVFVDFGWFGLGFMFLWGALVKFFWVKVKEGKAIFIPIYLFIVFIILFMPTVNLITAGMGFIFIHSLFIPILLYFAQKEIRSYFNLLRHPV